jgi:hypothetical protein
MFRRALSPWTFWLALAAALGLAWAQVDLWTAQNGLPDGHQNEFLHVGNALDLWGAWVDRDAWHLRYYLSTNYWPPGFYLWPWPWMMALGAGHRAMVLANIGHLAVLLWAAGRGAEALAGRGAALWTMALLSLTPSVYGNLVRFEPNLAVAAWVSVAALWLGRSEALGRGRESVMFGLACGVGMLMDRLSMGIFLAPAALWVIFAAPRSPGDGARRLRGVGLALLTSLALCGPWLWQFLQLHREELLSQTATGEIDSTGAQTESRAFFSASNLLYYPLSLLDGQAGLALGGLALVAFGAALFARSEAPSQRAARQAQTAVILSGVVVFTLIAKKQAFYTIPALGALMALTGAWLSEGRAWRRWLGAAVVIVGLHQQQVRLWGAPGFALPAALSGPSLPEAWVSPRHPQALPPRGLRLPLDDLAASLGGGEVITFSEDPVWAEIYLNLQLRERLPGQAVRGVLTDPQGAFEWLGVAEAFVWVSVNEGGDWPGLGRIESALVEQHYQLSELPPVAEAVSEARGHFQLVAWWPLQGGGRVRAYRRAPSPKR